MRLMGLIDGRSLLKTLQKIIIPKISCLEKERDAK